MSKKLIFMLSLLMAGQTHGVEPYDNIAGPDGSYLLLYPAYYTADKFADSTGDVVTDDLQLRSYSNVFRLSIARTTDESKKKWLGTLLVPMADVQTKAGRDQGLGDITLGSAYWVVTETRSWWVLAGFVDAPTGRYDSNKEVNVGSNAWKVRPTVGFAKQFDKFDLELTYRYNIYFRNESTDLKSGNESIFESYLGYFVRPNFMVGAHANLINGEDATINGVKIADSGVRKYQVGPSMNWVYGKTSGATFVWLSDTHTNNGPEGDLFMMRLFWKL